MKNPVMEFCQNSKIESIVCFPYIGERFKFPDKVQVYKRKDTGSEVEITFFQKSV